jgi:asparagine synthase (glutamine-hydrolysing)
MCGVAGIIQLDRSGVAENISLSMIQKMKFRGPDGEGFFNNLNVSMGMCRLSIIDLATGTQPISNETGDVHAVLNGELYNFKELNESLKRRGHTFKTNSDVECLVHLYEEKGTQAIHDLNGMFGFSLYDKKTDFLWVARDRLGIKPLYYFYDEKTFAFSSNLDSLLEGLRLTPQLDPIAIAEFLTLSFVPAPRTIYKNIRKLQPGHQILVQNGKLKIEKYWDPTRNAQSKSSVEETAEKVKQILWNSIELQIQSDVPVGSLLSGGFDSSIVTTLASRAMSKPMKTFTINFEGKSRNEGQLAKLVSQKVGTEHFEESLEVDTSLSSVAELAPFMDEPMGDTAIVPSYRLSELAQSQGVKVLLSGAGGDELFAGYLRHKNRWQDSITKANLPIRQNNFARSILPRRLQRLLWSAHSETFAYALATTGPDLGLLSDVVKDNSLLVESIREIEKQLDVLKNKDIPLTNRRLLADVAMYLPDNILALFDKTSMASSIEGRVPLLDHRLVELMLSTDQSESVNLEQKKILRQAYEDIVPKEILNQPKTGFNGPVHAWAQRISWNRVIETLQLHGIGVAIDWKTLKRHCAKPDIYNSQTLFNFYTLSEWLKGRKHGNA